GADPAGLRGLRRDEFSDRPALRGARPADQLLVGRIWGMAVEDARVAVAAPAVPRAAAPSRPAWGRALLTFGRRRTLGAAGGVVVILMILTAIFAGVIAPYDPKDTSFLEQLKAPSAQHLLGTDSFGRDVFSRIIYGARTALLIGFFAAFVGSSLGALLGVI